MKAQSKTISDLKHPVAIVIATYATVAVAVAVAIVDLAATREDRQSQEVARVEDSGPQSHFLRLMRPRPSPPARSPLILLSCCGCYCHATPSLSLSPCHTAPFLPTTECEINRIRLQNAR